MYCNAQHPDDDDALLRGWDPSHAFHGALYYITLRHIASQYTTIQLRITA